MDYVSLTYYNILLVYRLVQGYNSSNHKFLFPHLNPVVLHLFFCIMCQSPTLSFEKNVKETFLRSLTNLPFPALLLTAESWCWAAEWASAGRRQESQKMPRHCTFVSSDSDAISVIILLCSLVDFKGFSFTSVFQNLTIICLTVAVCV